MSGCSSTSTPVTVTVNPNPTAPTITAGGTTTFCDGGSVTLTSSQGTGNTWSTTETTQSISVTTSGNYNVTYENANGCKATSADIAVTVNPLPTVTLSALGTVCDYDAPFALSGGTPAGGTFSGTGVSAGHFDPSSAGLGTYTITYEYTDMNGCVNTDTEDIIVDACLSIEDISGSDFVSIYPNPFNNNVTIELEGQFIVSMMDARGRVVMEKTGVDKIDIEATQLEAGVYMLSVQNNSNEFLSRIVKQ